MQWPSGQQHSCCSSRSLPALPRMAPSSCPQRSRRSSPPSASSSTPPASRTSPMNCWPPMSTASRRSSPSTASTSRPARRSSPKPCSRATSRRRRNRALDAIETVDVTAQPALTAAVLTDLCGEVVRPDGQEGQARRQREALPRPGHLPRGARRIARGPAGGRQRHHQPGAEQEIPLEHLRRGVPERRQGPLQVPVHLRLRRALGHGQGTRRLEPLGEAGRNGVLRIPAGRAPGVIPNSALFYHTTAVAPKWSHTFRRVAAIGSHVFYSQN